MNVKDIVNSLLLYKSDATTHMNALRELNTTPVDGIIFKNTKMFKLINISALEKIGDDYLVYKFPIDRYSDIISNIQGINCSVKVEINFELCDIDDILIKNAPYTDFKCACLFNSTQPFPEEFGVMYDSYLLQSHICKDIQNMEIFTSTHQYRERHVSKIYT
jgi:hypothetical protein